MWQKKQIAYLLSKEGVGSRRLITQFLNSELSVLKEELSSSSAEVESFAKHMLRSEIEAVGFWEEGYPESLAAIGKEKPAMLFFKGDMELCAKRAGKKYVAVVGSRQITEYTKSALGQLFGLRGECCARLVYISGLAYGVDAFFHNLAIESGIKTIAVVAGGVDCGFPSGNRWLYEKIVKEGLVMSEFPSKRHIFKGMFPMRNRLIAALADLVIVVQAGRKSGALSTASWASKFGKPVYVVPGRIDDEAYQGGHDLLSNVAAKPLTSRSQFADLVGVKLGNNILERNYVDSMTKLEANILGVIGKTQTAVTFDELSKKLGGVGLNVHSKIVKSLTKLEMQGILRLNNAGKYELIKKI